MIAANKIHAKAFKEKMRSAMAELGCLIDKSGLRTRQKEYLFARMSEYKQTGGGTHAHFGQENFANSNENSWSPKDVNAEVREKLETIRQLQKAVQGLQAENQMLQESGKRRAVEEESANINDKILADLSADNLRLRNQRDELKRELAEMKLSNQNAISRYQDKAERLERAVREMEASRSEKVAVPDTATPTNKIHDLQTEVLRYREKILGLAANLAASEKVIRQTQEEVEILRRGISEQKRSVRAGVLPEHVKAESLEAILAEEVKSVAEAFEKAASNNRDLERQIATLHKKAQEAFSDNAQLKNKLKLLEDDRVFIENEKRRFDSCKRSLEELNREIAARADQLNSALSEKENKSVHYKAAMKEMEHNLAVAGKEVQNIKNAYKSAMGELEKTQAQLAQAELDKKKQENLANTYKALVKDNGVVSVLEDVEMYRRALRCSVCNTNLKNCALSKCMHCFCLDCVDSQFKSRNRRCPICDCDFALSDVKKLFLNGTPRHIT